jgi:alkanesulfonate monooxygenase SsuD/methylene tetrahydromethanopterin reductase-like flavin-dependent oxidoreductase (luciferase family)
VTWAQLEDAWAEAGRHDVFDSGWMNDHLGLPGRDRGGSSFEPLTALAALAHHVPGKTIGQTVLSATFRHPSILAREALTLDHITGGRYVLAIGAGWHQWEHDAFGIELPPIGERLTRLEAQVAVIRALFSKAAQAAPGVRVEAPPYRLDGATQEPPPIHPGGPLIWLGGQGPRGLRIAARVADGWNYASNLDGTLEGFVERRDIVLRECEALGRDPAELELSVQVIIPPDGEPRRTATSAAIAYGRAGAFAHSPDDAGQGGANGIRRPRQRWRHPSTRRSDRRWNTSAIDHLGDIDRPRTLSRFSRRRASAASERSVIEQVVDVVSVER